MIILLAVLCISLNVHAQSDLGEKRVLSYEVSLETETIRFFWKNNVEENYGSLARLKKELDNREEVLTLAMNGGMYLKDRSPQGLYIEKGLMKSALDTLGKGYGNFYLQPNGIFYIAKNKSVGITTTKNFMVTPDITYATQSGPMLLIDGDMHPAFNEGSSNVHIRNAVGILPNGNPLFVISTEKLNFYDLACYFKEKGCKNALYLDGFVSRAYIPSKNWKELDGDFGVIIGVTKRETSH